jgi:ArsR family transcriptional regulator
MTKRHRAATLSPALLGLVAQRFQALGEPARLEILQALRDRERTVTEIGAAANLRQANLSKHLQLLHRLGLVERRKEGLYVRYRLADPDVARLCDIMCGRVAGETRRRQRLFGS